MSKYKHKKIFIEQNKNAPVSVALFTEYLIPNGHLTTQPECHALFYYYLNARRTYEEKVKDSPIVYEDDPDPTYNFRQLFTSIATLYNVEPEQMANCWEDVDKQCLLLGLPLMPDEEKYRFNAKLIIQ